MEDNIDDILENVSNNFFSQFPNSNNNNNNNVPRTSTNNRNRTNQHSNANPSPSMRYVNRQLDTIYETMINYNTTMLQYQANIREMLRLMNVNSMNYRLRMNENRQPHQSRNTPNIFRHFTNTTTQRQNGNNSFLFSQWTQPLFNQTRPRILSQTQINQYTTTFTYSDQSHEHINETRCPISLENFQNGDSLCQIIGCGHVFLKSNLMNWFRRSHQCPICRYDLMNNQPQQNTESNEINPQQNAETNPQQNAETNQNNPPQQNIGTNIQQNLEQEMYNLMQSFIDASISELGSNYDISVNSIPLNDMSGLSSIFIPNNVSNNVRNDVSNNVRNDVSNNVPNDASNNAPNDVSNNVPNDASNNAPNDVSSNAPNDAPNDASNNDSDDEIDGDLSVD